MKYCSKCGKEIVDEAVICPGCGCAQENNVQGNSVPQVKEALNDIGMKYCSKCGKEIMGEAVICPGCGCAQGNDVQGNNVTQVREALSNVGKEAMSNIGSLFGWSLLGFFIPIVGIILYFVWKETSPSKAKVAGSGALISIGFSLVLSIVYGIIALISILYV